MKKTLSILILGVLPVVALAHEAGHGMQGPPRQQGQQMMQKHDMAGTDKVAHASMAGNPGHPSMVSRTIEIVMDDSMRFTPEKISVKLGETVRFVVKNAGKIPHEMALGTPDELVEHTG